MKKNSLGYLAKVPLKIRQSTRFTKVGVFGSDQTLNRRRARPHGTDASEKSGDLVMPRRFR